MLSYLSLKPKILADFQICISGPLSLLFFRANLVKRLSVVEFIFIAWKIWNISVGHRWQLFVNCRWMVWSRMDVERGVVWLPMRKSLSVSRLNEISRNSFSAKFATMIMESTSDLNTNPDINAKQEGVICVWHKLLLL